MSRRIHMVLAILFLVSLVASTAFFGAGITPSYGASTLPPEKLEQVQAQELGPESAVFVAVAVRFGVSVAVRIGPRVAARVGALAAGFLAGLLSGLDEINSPGMLTMVDASIFDN